MKYTWKQFDKDVKLMAEWVKQNKYSDIYGIPKGGLVLAVRLCYLCELPLVIDKEKITSKTLIVDDISDTGKTLKEFKDKGNAIATLFWHKQTISMPTFFIREKKRAWVFYPWER